LRISKNKSLPIILFLLVGAIFLASYKFKTTPGNLRTFFDDILIFINQPYLINKDYSHYELKDINQITKNFFISLKNFNNHKNYEDIKIEVSFKNYLKLMENRNKAVQTRKNNNFLSDKTKVKGFITYKNNKIPVKIRLKGDRADHWLSKKRFSLFIEITGNHSLFGFKNFSITNHLSRQFPQNVIIAKSLKRNNLLNYEFKTIKVGFNEQNWGLMLAQEEISPYYFESRKIKETPIARYTNEEDRRLLSKLTSTKITTKEIYNYTKLQSIYEIDIKKQNKYLQNENNRNIISFLKSFHLDNLTFNNISSQNLINHFDIDKFATLIAYSIAFGDLHNTYFTNTKFYFNPYTNKVEPIPNDYEIGYFDTRNSKAYLKNLEIFLKRETSKIYINLFNNINFQEKLFHHLQLIKNDLDLMNNDLLSICYNFVNCSDSINFNLIKNNLDFLLTNKLKIIDVLEKVTQIEDEDMFKIIKFQKIKIKDSNKNILEREILKHLKNYLYFRTFNDGEVKIKNLTLFKIKIKNIIFHDNKRKEIKCLKKKFNEIKINSNQKINLTLNLTEPCKLISNFIETKLIFEVKDNTHEQTSFLENSKIKSVHNLSYKNLKKTKLILSGNLLIKEPIILEKNQDLIIEGNTVINFGPNSYILVDGGMFICKGEKKRNIKLTSLKNKFWGGIYVRNSDKVDFENCTIENTKEFRSFNKYFTSLTGGVNIYNSNVNLKNVIFKNSNAEDALNLINSKNYLENIKVINAKSDGIDFDFSTGIINNAKFHLIGGDGLDFSGSNFEINNINIKNSKDKGISIGEESKIVAKNITLINNEIGIAVKDNSLLNLTQGNFRGNNFDISAFNKKAYYKKGGIINMKNVSIDNKKISFDKNSIINFLN
tara:strand:+ start:3881 stop:6529 length:2649 start_codon:yes stop_codon:yes gene_type:complete